jgi:hypothetical protein
MKTDLHPSAVKAPNPNAAADYRTTHRNRLMVLTKLKGDVPTREEFCRVFRVETVEPSLWITADFLDGSSRGMRPDKIRLATGDEERLSHEALG